MARKGRARPLLRGALAHSADTLKLLAKDKRVPPEATRLLLEIVKRSPLGEAVNTVLQLVRPDGSLRPIAQVMAEGPLPGRMPRPRAKGAEALPPEKPREGFTRGVARAASLEPAPGEFKVLREAKTAQGDKIITQASEEAAKRLGFETGQNGSALDALYRFIYPALLRQSVKGVGHEGLLSNLAAPLTEFALNQHPELRSLEAEAIQAALAKMPDVRVANYADLPKGRMIPLGAIPDALNRTPGQLSSDAFSMLRTNRVAEGVFDVELHNVRDSGGTVGWAVTDRLRGLLDMRKTPPGFVVVSIGEAKAKSKSGEIIGQTVQDVERLLAGFRAPEGGSGAPRSFEPAQVTFGPRLVVASLSEKRPPRGHVAALERNMRSVFKSSKLTAPKIIPHEIDPGGIFKDARTVTGQLQEALNVLAQTPAK